MKRVYICSPFRANGANELRRNIAYARMLVHVAIEVGAAPYAPHLYLPDVLNDGIAELREKGMSIGLHFLDVCDEIWVGQRFRITAGMQREIEYAKARNIPVRIYENGECRE